MIGASGSTPTMGVLRDFRNFLVVCFCCDCCCLVRADIKEARIQAGHKEAGWRQDLGGR